MRNMINTVHLEGYIYEHALERRISGETSKNPGTEFIMGTLSIATDDQCTNIVPVHFTYVTAVTNKGNTNATFGLLNDIIDGNVGTVMANGKENAGKVRIDTSIALNDFYVDRNGTYELVSAKRNEGGFVHITEKLANDEKSRNLFQCDIVITKVSEVEADESRGLPAKVVIKGAIFDFKKSLLPVDFMTSNPKAMAYFMNLDASAKNPVFTKIWGRQISQTVVTRIEEESAFDEAFVRETTSTKREWVVTGAALNPYVWDDDSTITARELTEAVSQREIYLATVKQRQIDYRNSRSTTTTSSSAAPSKKTASIANGGFDF